MLFPIEDPDEWASKYKLKIKKTKCFKCDKDIILNVPIVDGKIRGFTSNHIECGEQYRQITFTVKVDDLLGELKECK